MDKNKPMFSKLELIDLSYTCEMSINALNLLPDNKDYKNVYNRVTLLKHKCLKLLEK